MTRGNAGGIACDVLIVGSGAAGLCAAVTAAEAGLDVILAEKEPVFGGTSAWSGGWLWVPRNPLARAAGIEEDREAPRRYLRHMLGHRAEDPRLSVFLENAPDMVGFLSDIGAMRWVDGNSVPDFHAHDSAATGGRAVCAAPYDARVMGPLIDRLRPPLDVMSLAGLGIASGADLAHFFNASRSVRSFRYVAWRLARHARDLLTRGRAMQLVGGNALVARLLAAADARGVRLWHGAEVTELCRDGTRVTGAVLHREGRSLMVHARRGVVLAAGGFPHDPARHSGLFPHVEVQPHASAAPRGNTGDGLRLAERAGAALDMSLAQPAAWAPVSLVPDGRGGHRHFPHLIDRAKPGFVAVAGDGRRFVNEAESYHDFVAALLDRTTPGQVPACWLICDARAQRRFGIGWAKPFPFPLGPYLRSGYLKQGRTLAELAQACALPSATLEDTIARFNAQAKRGHDPDFQRGASAYNRVQGWAAHGGPNPSLGALQKAPFYAVQLVPGSLGTFAGIRTAAGGEALDTKDRPVPGLFAIGNDAASVMGGHYPSGGITLGPGMTFGYVVARKLAGLPVAELPDDTFTDLKQEKAS